jgi:hypothetical protein
MPGGPNWTPPPTIPIKKKRNFLSRSVAVSLIRNSMQLVTEARRRNVDWEKTTRIRGDGGKRMKKRGEAEQSRGE